jgi:hypothetical protein
MASSPVPLLPLSYVLPIKHDTVTPDADLDGYLHRLAGEVAEVLVVDGSPPDVFADHARRWGDAVRHLVPDRSIADPPDKPVGVVTGARVACQDVIVVADDDVRWERADLAAALGRMDGVDLVRPHNRFDPAPWHARWDTGRTLLNRAFGGDWPGTLAVRRRYVVDGYGRDVLFENLDLVRTVAARGGRVSVARDLVVVRRPPEAGWFLRQRVRQAYDEMARPWQLAWQLTLLPAAVLGGRRAVAGMSLAAVIGAEVGRRRGGTAGYPATAALWAPAWLVERGLCSWAAVAARARGGVRYRGRRVRRAATPVRELRAAERRLPGEDASGRRPVGAIRTAAHPRSCSSDVGDELQDERTHRGAPDLSV